MEIMKNEAGEQIRIVRLSQGMTQKELSDKTGISIVMISQYENGARNPKIDKLFKIAKALNISIDILLLNDKKNTCL